MVRVDMSSPSLYFLPVFFLLFMLATSSAVRAVEFDTDMLDAKDARNVDFSRFSTAGYVMPGRYSLTIVLNDRRLGTQNVDVYPEGAEKSDTPTVCLTAGIIDLLGLRRAERARLDAWHQNQCISLAALQGESIRIDLSQAELNITLPQAYLDERNPDWDPPSRWDNGIPGAFIDYNFSTTVNKPEQSASETRADVFGTVGANAGAWRFRGDYQGTMSRESGRVPLLSCQAYL